ncbi:MAG: glycerol-3-phosphate 1-O-acyltransferase PlsY [Gemmatimonadetes bacterium]|nr:glycerol-3-phosphate 1-O-acyltransferase PlsY [Gemmatimonadota bacterium]
MAVLLTMLAAYVLGSIPTSYLVGRLVAGMDLRQHGSRNLGATNVFRVLGWKYGVPVLLFDVGKGLIAAVFLAPLAGSQPWMPLAIGSAAIVGHVYTVFLGFHGGKGVATAAGVLLGVAPLAVGICAALWSLLVLATGYVSLGSIAAAIAFPIVTRLLMPGAAYTFVAGLAVAGLILYTHRTNIRRLLNGSESRFGHRRKEG